MASIVPISNAKLQGSLDLNNQSLLGTNSAKRFTELNIGATGFVVTASAIDKLIKFSGYQTLTIDTGIYGIQPGDTFTVTSDSATGYNLSGSATKYVAFLESYANATSQFIYVTIDTWIVLNTN